MKLDEYASYDGLGLGELVAKGDVTPSELARTAAAAIKAVNGETKAVIETYEDRIEGLDEESLGHGPFRGVPFLMKDVFGHEQGRLIEFGGTEYLVRGRGYAQSVEDFEDIVVAGGDSGSPIRVHF